VPVVDTFLLVKSFVTMIVVIDPVSSVPLFLALTDRYEPRQRHRAAWQAVLVAALIIGVFALFGQQILLYLGIRLPNLEAAGGLLLLVAALDLLRGEVEGPSGVSQVNIAFVPLGTPLLAGRARSRRSWVCSCARLVVLWLTLRFAGAVRRVLGQPGIELGTRSRACR
jgi:multiple antibiotic resistance protein